MTEKEEKHQPLPVPEDSYKQKYFHLIDTLVSCGSLRLTKQTLICTAVEMGNVDLVERLISKLEVGVNNTEDERHRTLLYIACERGHYDLVKFLLSKGAQQIASSGSDYETPLYVASEKGHYDIVKLLLSKIRNIDETKLGGYTALYGACIEAHIPVIELLLHSGARVIEPSDEQLSYLELLCYGQSPSQVSWLSRIKIVTLLMSSGGILRPIDIFPNDCPLEFRLVTDHLPMVILYERLRLKLLGRQVRARSATLRHLTIKGYPTALFSIVQLITKAIPWDLQMMIVLKVIRGRVREGDRAERTKITTVKKYLWRSGGRHTTITY